MDSRLKRHFTAQFLRHQNRVFAFIVTLLPDRNEAEEAFQETGLLLWENWHKYDPTREFVPWACGFAFNVVRDFRKKKGRNPSSLSDDILADLAETHHKAEEMLEYRRQALAHCMKKLGHDHAALLKRCYLGTKNLKTVAEHLNIAPHTLYKRLERIRHNLFECINRQVRGEVNT